MGEKSLREVEKIVIYDFDGTLFRSPCPSTHLWDRITPGRLISSQDDGGYGWFQNHATLAPPAVPESPPLAWFIENTVISARADIDDPTALAILMTGRGDHFTSRVVDICAAAGLVFDRHFLKPQPEAPGRPFPATMTYKANALGGVIDQVIAAQGGSRKFRHVQIWEDRPRQAKRFEEFLERKSEQRAVFGYDIVMVSALAAQLVPAVERDLVSSLVAPHNVVEDPRGAVVARIVEPVQTCRDKEEEQQGGESYRDGGETCAADALLTRAPLVHRHVEGLGPRRAVVASDAVLFNMPHSDVVAHHPSLSGTLDVGKKVILRATAVASSPCAVYMKFSVIDPITGEEVLDPVRADGKHATKKSGFRDATMVVAVREACRSDLFGTSSAEWVRLTDSEARAIPDFVAIVQEIPKWKVVTA